MGKRIRLPVVGSPDEIPASAAVVEPAKPSRPRSVLDAIDEEVKANKVIIYMKGTPSQPMCGFSARAVEILDRVGRPYTAVDVLADPARREGIKRYGNWPTIPQVYVDSELVGGSDILREMYDSGELQSLIDSAFD